MTIYNRTDALVNQPVKLGFRHFYNNVLADVDSFVEIRIYNPSLQVVAVIPPASIQHISLGTYEVVVSGTVFNQIGQFRDVWSFIPVPAATQRNLQFTIDVKNMLSEPALNFMQIENCTVADLDPCMLKRNYLWPVWNVLGNGYYLPDAVLQYHIDTALSWAQRQIGIPFRKKRVLTRPYADGQTPANPVLGVDYDEDGELLQWSVAESLHWSSIRLPHSNIIRVLGVRGIYGGKTVYKIPTEWVDRNQFKNGIVRVRPTTAGSISTIIDGDGRFLDVTLLESIGANTVPGFWAIDYEYGNENNMIAKELCALVMKKAAVLLLSQLGMAISKGLSSRAASVDGLSSSVSFVANAERSMFGALAAEYESELTPENLVDMRRRYKGPTVFFI